MKTNIIDTSYFDGPLILPALSDAGSRAALEGMIDFYQSHYLIGVLGYTLGNLFIQALQLESTSAPGGFTGGFDSGFENGNTAVDRARFSFIRDGITYPYEGSKIRWNGLKNTQKKSPLANFVYYQIKEQEITQSSQSGEVKSKNEAANRASPRYKMIRAYNEMVEENRILFGMVSTLHLPLTAGGPPEMVFPELMPNECNPSLFIKINEFGI